MIDYKAITQEILNCFNKTELEVYESMQPFDSLHLASMGHNDTEGYQVFTPEFIVKDMCSAIGDDIFDFSKYVLEPTSGDGAFTVYILLRRLEKALKGDDFELDSLRALSTIYSIEMDKELIEKQRNNILTAMVLFLKDYKLVVPEGFLDVFKCIIVKNFIWAMFNDDPDTQSMASFNGEVDIAFAMPNAEKNKANDNYLLMPVWSISKDSIIFHEEGVEQLW